MIFTLLVTVCAVTLSVAIHYEALHLIFSQGEKIPIRPRRRAALGLLGALAAHVVEICVFGAGYYVLLKILPTADLQGDFSGSLNDCLYFSFVVFTTLGFGDITPVGWIRYMTAMEALTGLVLVAWTASFMFLQMQQWRSDQ